VGRVNETSRQRVSLVTLDVFHNGTWVCAVDCVPRGTVY